MKVLAPAAFLSYCTRGLWRSRLAGLLAAGWLTAAVIVGCQDQGQQAPSADTDFAGRVPQQQFFDYRLIETETGVRQWVLESDEMQKFAGQEDILLITVKMDFFKNGEHFSTLTSDSGSANLQTKNVHTWGDVVVVTDDGRRLETEELYFDNDRQLIFNDVFDRFTRDMDIVTGIGLEATPDLEYIEIKEQVSGAVGDQAPTESDNR